MAARYAFAALSVVIVWHSMRWLRRDSLLRRKKLSALPDAGYVGTLYVMAGESKGMGPGEAFQLPTEGVLGSGTGCDVRIPHPTVGGRHAVFEFREDGLHLRPYRDERLQVDGQPLPQGCEAILQHGAVVTLGGVMLQFRLFAGIQTPAVIRSDSAETKRDKRSRRAEEYDAPPISARPVAGKRGKKRRRHEDDAYDEYEQNAPRGAKPWRDGDANPDDAPVYGRRRR